MQNLLAAARALLDHHDRQDAEDAARGLVRAAVITEFDTLRARLWNAVYGAEAEGAAGGERGSSDLPAAARALLDLYDRWDAAAVEEGLCTTCEYTEFDELRDRLIGAVRDLERAVG